VLPNHFLPIKKASDFKNSKLSGLKRAAYFLLEFYSKYFRPKVNPDLFRTMCQLTPEKFVKVLQDNETIMEIVLNQPGLQRNAVRFFCEEYENIIKHLIELNELNGNKNTPDEIKRKYKRQIELLLNPGSEQIKEINETVKSLYKKSKKRELSNKEKEELKTRLLWFKHRDKYRILNILDSPQRFWWSQSMDDECNYVRELIKKAGVEKEFNFLEDNNTTESLYKVAITEKSACLATYLLTTGFDHKLRFGKYKYKSNNLTANQLLDLIKTFKNEPKVIKRILRKRNIFSVNGRNFWKAFKTQEHFAKLAEYAKESNCVKEILDNNPSLKAKVSKFAPKLSVKVSNENELGSKKQNVLKNIKFVVNFVFNSLRQYKEVPFLARFFKKAKRRDAAVQNFLDKISNFSKEELDLHQRFVKFLNMINKELIASLNSDYKKYGNECLNKRSKYRDILTKAKKYLFKYCPSNQRNNLLQEEARHLKYMGDYIFNSGENQLTSIQEMSDGHDILFKLSAAESPKEIFAAFEEILTQKGNVGLPLLYKKLLPSYEKLQGEMSADEHQPKQNVEHTSSSGLVIERMDEPQEKSFKKGEKIVISEKSEIDFKKYREDTNEDEIFINEFEKFAFDDKQKKENLINSIESEVKNKIVNKRVIAI
jgi:hypothetical protein